MTPELELLNALKAYCELHEEELDIGPLATLCIPTLPEGASILVSILLLDSPKGKG